MEPANMKSLKFTRLERHKWHLDWLFENRYMELVPLSLYKNKDTPIKYLWLECGHCTWAIPNNIKKYYRCGICRYINSKKKHIAHLDWLFKTGIWKFFR